MYNKCDSCSLGQTLRFCRVSDPVDEHNANHTEYVVDTDKEIRQGCGPEVDLKGLILILVADRLLLNLAIVLAEVIIWVLFLLLLAEAL